MPRYKEIDQSTYQFFNLIVFMFIHFTIQYDIVKKKSIHVTKAYKKRRTCLNICLYFDCVYRVCQKAGHFLLPLRGLYNERKYLYTKNCVKDG